MGAGGPLDLCLGAMGFGPRVDASFSPSGVIHRV